MGKYGTFSNNSSTTLKTTGEDRLNERFLNTLDVLIVPRVTALLDAEGKNA